MSVFGGTQCGISTRILKGDGEMFGFGGKKQPKDRVCGIYVQFLDEYRPRFVRMEPDWKWHIKDKMLYITDIGDTKVVICLENVVFVSEDKPL